MTQIFFHTPYTINCGRIISQFIKGEKHLKYYNNYLVPYHCSHINHEKQVILGNFVHPMWGTAARNVLNKTEKFNHSYVKGSDFTLEFNPSAFKQYNILNQSNLHLYPIQVSDILLKPNSILLFSIHKDVAEPLIKNKLM
jgi:hypothetical protein